MFKFKEDEINYLRTLAINGNELYDFSDAKTQAVYNSLLEKTKASVYPRDTSSFKEIESSVEHATLNNKGDGIILLSGAYPHMIGAIYNLTKKYNIVYVPIGIKISTKTKDPDSTSGYVTSSDLDVQMERDIGLVRHLNFDTMERCRSFLDSQKYDPNKQTMVIIAANETGLHAIHATYSTNEYHIQLYTQLTNFVQAATTKPFIIFVSEDLNVTNAKQSLKSTASNTLPKFEFLRQCHQMGAPVEIRAFGHAERTESRPIRSTPKHEQSDFFSRSKKSQIVYSDGPVELLGPNYYAQSKTDKRYILREDGKLYKIINGIMHDMTAEEKTEFLEAIEQFKNTMASKQSQK